MVEEMYQQEAREEEESRRRSDRQGQSNQTTGSSRNITAAQTPTPLPPPPPVLLPAAAATASSAYSSATATTAAAADTATPTTKRTHFSSSDRQYCSASENQAKQLQQQPPLSLAPPSNPAVPQRFPADMHHYRSPDTAVDRDIGNAATADKIVAGSNAAASTPTRFGTIAAGDVSLTLGLRHAGNAPEKSAFSNGDFGSGQLFQKNYWQGP
ncbi:hypothetical protein Nepgr_016587 [Nepenthes gracilis]|uniref:Uncharacterized protein n=1 Tax=Nepenthes gracilis TaxID=150966 RepID=A0AAD3XSH0_NEPGR|nr:hypothetical protein Nepgr_016587 [Nepenthes gracilis]